MTLTEFYTKIDGDYAGTMSRLITEQRILKYLNKFVFTSDYQDFKSNYAEKKYEDAFRNIHSLKGVCLNLGITKLGSIASDVCEGLRGGTINYPVEDKLDELEEVYLFTIDAIKDLIPQQ